MILDNIALSLYHESKREIAIMKVSLSKKESMFLAELADILLKYDAVLQCGENGNMEILVFEGAHEDTYIPVRFAGCMDETDIEELLECNAAEFERRSTGLF